MDRSNHYEAAFEAYLRWHQLPYVAVDESRRVLFGDDGPVKSLDFLVFGTGGERLVVDVKGRRFPAGPPAKPRRVWECWSTREDVESLGRWAELAGPGSQAVLLFAFHLHPAVVMAQGTPGVWAHGGRRYLLRAVAVDEYRRHMRTRSARWGTVHVPVEAFRTLVRPVYHFTHRSSPLLEASTSTP